ncbi:CIC11C00000002836 [Sungouiella intermedia]|uniref:2'-phosphotransferase n=1 Tax=Sungouiella intermedia TaxID=45354 RepID=A0A1L0B8R0_9ASCO|nr:CIC11C00000002836 [[Candida] intermedia]
MADKRDVQISKSLSYLLRHGAEKEKLAIDPQGWIALDVLLNHHRLKSQKASVTDIERIVAQNDKQRFSLKSVDDSVYICANQGHTLKAVTPELELLTSETMPANVYHGTFRRKLPAIEQTGLSRMQRNHIHFTSDAEWSKLGIRPNCDVLIYIDTSRLLDNGYELYRSRNGVILCGGNADGVIPAYYFSRIVTRDSDGGDQC